MKCPKCGNDYDSKFCSQCGYSAQNATQPVPPQPPTYPQPPMYPHPPIVPQPKKKGKGCLISAIVAAVVVALVILSLAAGSNGSDSTTAPNTTAAPSLSQSTTTPAAATTAPLGMKQTGTYRKYQITVTKMRRTNGNDFDRPKDGMEFIVITVQIKNIGQSGNISYNPWDFKLKNGNGQITNETLSTVNNNDYLSVGDLAPGGTVSGSMIFQAPKGDNNLSLQFYGSLSSSPSLEFKLG